MGWIVLQFECDTLQCLACTFHDFLTSCSRTCETDLVDTGMSCEHWSEAIITAENIDDTWGEELLGELDKFQIAVWCEGAWFVSLGKMMVGLNLTMA